MRKLVAAAAAVLLLGVGAYGISSVLPAGASSSAGHAALGRGGPGKGEQMKRVLDTLVADGTISQEQEDKIIAAFQAAGPARGFGHPGLVLQKAVQTAAEALGMSVDDLKAELKAGKSIADVASAKGVSLDTVTTALTDAANTALDKAVTDKKITQERADAIKAKLPTIIDRFEHATRPAGVRGLKHHGSPDADSSQSSSSSSGGS